MSEGSLALAPLYKKGWKTYNFEVEDFHTYIAGGVRVHNQSVILASGTHVEPGTTWKRGDYIFRANDDGSVTNLTTGRFIGPTAPTCPSVSLSHRIVE